MSATNKTSNYELPLFVDSDQPTWLGDFNGAMNKIDADMAQVGTNAATALNTANSAALQASTAKTTADNALSLAQTNEQDIGTLDGQVAQIENHLTATDAAIAKARKDMSIVDYAEPEYVGDFIAYNGRFFDNANTDRPYINQGYCIGKNGVHQFALINDDDTKAAIATATDTYAISESTFSTWGHANCLAYNGNDHYYLYTGQVNNTLLVLNASDYTTAKTIATPEASYGNVAYDKVTGKVWYVTYAGAIYELVNETSLVRQTYSFPELFDQQVNIGQGMACYNGVAVFPVSAGKTGRPTGLIVGDITTGKILKHIAISSTNPLIGAYGELEDCDFDDDGNLYISAIKTHTTDAESKYCCGNYLYKCNIFTGSFSTSPIQLAVEWNLDSRVNNAFYSDGTVNHPFKDIAEWCMAAQTVPVIPKITKVGFTNTSAVTLNGFVILDTPRIYNLWFNGANNVMINGGIYVRGGSALNIVNRVTIRECSNSPYNTLFRLTNSALRCGTVSLNKQSSSKITKPMLLQYAVQANMQNLLVDGSAATPNTDTLSGFGYTIGTALTGKYV